MKKAQNIDWMRPTENGERLFTCTHAEIKFPKEYYDHKIAEQIGNQISIFGLFDIYIWKTAEWFKETPKKYFFKFKSKILTEPSAIKEEKIDGKPYVILMYNEGSRFIVSTDMQKDMEVAKQFLDIMTLGYLPNVIPYEDISQFWIDVNVYNGVKMSAVSRSMHDIMVAELCRDPDDLSRPFRARIQEDPDIDRTSWKMLGTRYLPRYVSTFASLTSGNPKQNLISVIANQRRGAEQIQSPIEEAIM